MSDLGMRLQEPADALPNPVTATNVTYGPSLDRLRELARDDEITTEYDSPAYVSEHRSRNAARTRNAVDDDFGATDCEYVETAYRAARTREMLCLDRRVGRHPEHSYVCRLFVPREFARVALAWANLLDPVGEGVEPVGEGVEPIGGGVEPVGDGASSPAGAPTQPDFYTVQVPDHDEVAIRVLPEEGFTAVLGSDYTGEAKKSFLRLFMYRAKERGGLGLHAGTKRVTVGTDDGTETVGQVFLGLSGTGKSTLTAHDLGLEAPEDAAMIQDDVCALLPDGTVAGSEGAGLFIKTIGLDSARQAALHAAATHESAVLENVDVAPDGAVDFESDRHTSNARAIVGRDVLDSAADEIDLPEISQVFFITRNPAMPPIARLSPERAAAAFMLGESVETSAGDPSRAGEAIRVVGTNPFIVGSSGEEGNRFRDLIADLDVECFLLNTGSVGDRDVGVEDTVAILRSVTRGTVTWRTDEATDLPVPESVPGVDDGLFDVAAALDDHEERLAALRAERNAHLARFEDLADEIASAAY